MKLGELFVHIYYYTLNSIFYIKLLCMHDAMTCYIVAVYYSEVQYSVSYLPRQRSGERVRLGIQRTLGCWFEPTVHHYFSSSNVRLLA